MDTLAQPADITPEPAGPNITPLFTRLLEEEAARRGLSWDPWVA